MSCLRGPDRSHVPLLPVRAGRAPATAPWLAALAAAWLILLAGCAPAPRPPATFELRIRPLTNDPTRVTIIVTASDPGAWRTPSSGPQNWEAMLSVRLATNGPASAPLLGTHEVHGRELRFQPRYPLLSGETYAARFDAAPLAGADPSSAPWLTREYRVPSAAPGPVPRVLAIYPSSEVVPANHLKFYLIFSEPMRAGGIFRWFRLLDERGAPVPEPFRETELWSTDGRRLTLWFHPGRQKTGVNLNFEIGPILTEGRGFTLEISGDWPAQSGTLLGQTVRKPLRAGPPDAVQPVVATWRVQPPRAGAHGPLVVSFPEPLDWALLHSQLWLETTTGARVPGRLTVDAGETSWSFVPEQPWAAGDFHLAIGTVLEDLAGNSLARPFQVDVQACVHVKVAEVVYLPFRVEPGK